MAKTRSALAATIAAAFTLGAASLAPAQDKPKDDVLDRLLEKAEGKAPAPAEVPPKPKADDKAKPKPAEKPKEKPKAEAEPKDKALDGLLEKLGETKEAPKTTGPAGGAPDPADKPVGKPDDVTAGKLKEGEKPLDEHLERLTGRAEKKKPKQGEKEGQQGQQQGDGSDENTPIGRAVKKMRQVETKLGQDDTGDETRKTQGEIVKDLDNLIAQAKKQQQQMQMKKGQKRRPGQPQDGPPMGDQPGAQGDTAQGAKPMKTTDAKSLPSQVGDKNTWGNLPAMLRDEMENVFKSEPLPAKMERINRYYRAVAKKGMSSSSGG